MKKIVFLWCILVINVAAYSQFYKSDYFLTKIEFGTSLTYIWNDEALNDNYIYHELTWNLNGGISVSKYLNVGIQSMVIVATKYLPQDTATYNILGGFAQFNFINRTNFRLFGEFSLNFGDFCTAVKENYYGEPYRRAGLKYLGYGGSAQAPILKTKYLFLEVGFYNYIMLNKIEYKYNYTQYIIGINYAFGKLE